MEMLKTDVEGGFAENQEVRLRDKVSLRFHLDIQFERGVGRSSVKSW